mgnify:CR=1 FL=1
MLENEAIRILENEKPGCEEKVNFTEEEKCEAYDAAISALKKIHDYREMETKGDLLPCPFCGEKVEIQLTDNNGVWQGKNYLQNPVNGIGYVITHPSVPQCPIAASGERVGRDIYVSKDAAAKMWNRRAGK